MPEIIRTAKSFFIVFDMIFLLFALVDAHRISNDNNRELFR